MNPELHQAVREGVFRVVGTIALAGIALIHLLDSIGKYSETRYVFWMYVGLMVASLALAGLLMVRRPTRAVWLAVAGFASSAIAGYVISRTTGLPNAKGDIGNWTEPLGLASLFVEGALVTISSAALALLPAKQRLGSPLGVSIGAPA